MKQKLQMAVAVLALLAIAASIPLYFFSEIDRIAENSALVAPGAEVGEPGQPVSLADWPAGQDGEVQEAWTPASFYQEGCADCHGTTGQGTQDAPPLNTPLVQDMKLEDLALLIAYGKQGTDMTGWYVNAGGMLDVEQVYEMADYVQGAFTFPAGSQQASSGDPIVEVIDSALSAGLPVGVEAESISLYAYNCSSCHGSTGGGTNFAPPLNTAELRSRYDEPSMFSVISSGIAGTRMPAWDSRLSPDQISGLSELILNWDLLDTAQIGVMESQAVGTAGTGMGMGGTGQASGGGPPWLNGGTPGMGGRGKGGSGMAGGLQSDN
jgi:mono/diheme cytochrome c family protein